MLGHLRVTVEIILERELERFTESTVAGLLRRIAERISREGLACVCDNPGSLAKIEVIRDQTKTYPSCPNLHLAIYGVSAEAPWCCVDCAAQVTAPFMTQPITDEEEG